MKNTNRYAIGVDVGGTNIRIALISEDGTIEYRCEEKISINKSLDDDIETISRSINNIIGNSKKKHIDIKGVGIGVPGAVDVINLTLNESPNLKYWVGTSIFNQLKSTIGIPTFFGNDANLAALGEGWRGSGKEFDSFIFITLGTGVGGGLVLNRNLWQGYFDAVGEIGHTVVESEGRLCNCGKKGCLEAYSSATAIVKLVTTEIKKGKLKFSPDNNAAGSGNITAESMYKLAKEGNTYLKEIFNDVGKYLGISLSNILNILALEAVVLGGKMSNSWDLFIDSMRIELDEKLFSDSLKKVKSIRAVLGDDAGIFGGAKLVFDNTKKNKE